MKNFAILCSIFMCVINVNAQMRGQSFPFHPSELTNENRLSSFESHGRRTPIPEASAAFSEKGKPPLRPGRMIGQVIIGGAVGGFIGMGGVMAGVITERIVNGPCSGDWCGLGGALLGFAAGYTFGSALGVKIIGSRGNETGSFGAGIIGAVAGFWFWYFAFAGNSEDAWLANFWLWPPVGATLFFNATRRYKKTSPPNHALLNFNENHFQFGVPSIVVRPIHSVNGGRFAGSAAILSLSF